MHKFRWKKGLACGGLFLLLVGITLWLVLKDQNPAQLWTAVKQVRLPLLGVGLGCMAVYFCCEAKNIQTGMGSEKWHQRSLQCNHWKENC